MFKPNVVTFQKMFIPIVTVVALGTFFGCAKYRPRPLAKPIGVTVEQHGVKASAQRLSEADSKYYLGRRLLKKGYQPVQLCVQNDSSQAFVLDASTINMPIENRDYVASCARLDVTSRALGWTIGGCFLWPFLIPAIYEVFKIPKVNRRLDADFASRIVDSNSKVAINAHSTVNKVFFVRKENVSGQLEFLLKNSETEADTAFCIKV